MSSGAWPTPAQALGHTQQQAEQLLFEELQQQLGQQKGKAREARKEIRQLRQQMQQLLEGYQQEKAGLEAQVQAALGAARRLDKQLEAVQEQQWGFHGLVDQVNCLCPRNKPGMGVEFHAKKDFNAKKLAAGGAGRNGGVIRGWVECKGHPTNLSSTRPLQTFFRPAVAKVFRPEEDNEVHMSIEADWAGGMGFFGLFEVADDEGIERWMLVYEDAGICLGDLFKGGPEVRGTCSWPQAHQARTLLHIVFSMAAKASSLHVPECVLPFMLTVDVPRAVSPAACTTCGCCQQVASSARLMLQSIAICVSPSGS